ncbi:MAG: hypothetical protein ACOCWG_02200 [bacterium]
MIYFITTAGNTQTISSFFNTWGKKLKKQIRLIPYEKLLRCKTISSGTYFFCDLDLLNDEQLKFARSFYLELKKYPESYRMLNEPVISANRVQLLDKLFQEKINSFRCVSLTEIPDDLQFPVFIRHGIDHSGKISKIIYDNNEMKIIINRAINQGLPKDEIFITEFVDTAIDGKIYKKYSAFVLGDTILPRHIFYSNDWMIKRADLTSKKIVDEEFEYIINNPHKEFLRKVAKTANIDYGRIDYSMKDNQPVIWEINPNPMIASSSSLKKPQRKKIHEFFVSRFIASLEKIDIKLKDKTLPNPLFESELFNENMQEIFPFNDIEYHITTRYKSYKFILLYYFYSLRNIFKN